MLQTYCKHVLVPGKLSGSWKTCVPRAQGLGLPLEEAMRFWRAGFAARCAGDEFDKKYAYNVRYNYAKEGKRTDYTPYSCLKIISTPVPKARSPSH